MIRLFSLQDLESLLEIENQSFPKSPYDWTTFLSLHARYPQTFLVYISSSTLQIEASGLAPARDAGESRDPVAGDRSRREKISAYIIFSRDGHILSIAVHPHYRRRGVATELLRRAMEASRPRKVWAEVRRSNQGARAFYDTMGFQWRRTVRNYYGNEDALIVEWTPPG